MKLCVPIHISIALICVSPIENILFMVLCGSIPRPVAGGVRGVRTSPPKF